MMIISNRKDSYSRLWKGFHYGKSSLHDQIAEGFEALILAGRADANWLLLAAAALVLQAGVIFALGKTVNFPLSVALSAVAVIAVLLVFFIARAGLAMHYLRMAVLYVSVLIDVLIITRDMITKFLG